MDTRKPDAFPRVVAVARRSPWPWRRLPRRRALRRRRALWDAALRAAVAGRADGVTYAVADIVPPGSLRAGARG